MPHARLGYIDSLRGLAMLMILAFHCWVITGGVAIPVAVGRWHLDAALPLQFGYLGVHLFLVLSGFCLTYPLARSGAAGMTLDLRRFAGRRALRILPPYYIALAVFALRPAVEAAVRSALGHPDPRVQPCTAAEIISHLFMIHNFSPAWVRTINGSFWSLALEWQLYLVFPLLVAGFRRWGPVRVLAGVLILNLGYRSWVYLLHPGAVTWPYDPPDVAVLCLAYMQVPGRLLEFTLGMLAAVALAGRREIPSRAWRFRYLAGCALFALMAFGVARGWSCFAPITEILWGLAFFCLVMYAGGRSAAGGGWLDSSSLMTLGTISYSVYLIHEPLIRWIHDVIGPHRFSPLATLAFFCAVVAPLVVACGWIFYCAVEARFVRSSRRVGSSACKVRAGNGHTPEGVSQIRRPQRTL